MSKPAPAASPIPQANPGAGYTEHRAEIDIALKRVAESGWYILGAEVEAFEHEFAAFIGVEHAVGVGNGTDAVELALRGCGVGQDDVVFTVSHTAVATVSAIERAGATPAFIDIDPVSFTMDPQALAAAVSRTRGRAVVPVHLYGHPADMEAITEIARRAGLLVVEDCAQSHGATIAGRMTGTWGAAAAFSFYPTKNLAALGDGGMVATNDLAVARRVRTMRQYGWEERYISAQRGFNTRLDEIQAAVLRARLSHLAEDNRRRRSIAQRYNTMLEGTCITRPSVATGVEHVFHQYVIRSPDRDGLQQAMRAAGIGSAIHYPVPVHLQPAYNVAIDGSHSLRNTERVAQDILSLPMYPQLDGDQVSRIGACVAEWSSATARA